MEEPKTTKKHENHPHNPIKEFQYARKHAFARFPLLFTLLGTFGVVATMYGFNGILENIPLLVNNPYISLIVGLVILVFTGTLYKKLG
jgi:uncharacterized membrane protein YphA (DoxX/SURF4 family)